MLHWPKLNVEDEKLVEQVTKDILAEVPRAEVIISMDEIIAKEHDLKLNFMDDGFPKPFKPTRIESELDSSVIGLCVAMWLRQPEILARVLDKHAPNPTFAEYEERNQQEHYKEQARRDRRFNPITGTGDYTIDLQRPFALPEKYPRLIELFQSEDSHKKIPLKELREPEIDEEFLKRILDKIEVKSSGGRGRGGEDTGLKWAPGSTQDPK